MTNSFVVRLLAGEFAICRLMPDALIPERPDDSEFWSCTVTESEISVVCEAGQIPTGASKVDVGWSILYLDAQMDLDIVGVLATLLAPLRDAGISIFALSTFDTDYVLIRNTNMPMALEALGEAGYELRVDV